MKMLKWSLLVGVLAVMLGFALHTPSYAANSNSDEAVVTDDGSANDSEQYADPDTEDSYNQDEEGYDDSNDQEPGDEYPEEPVPENDQEESN